MDTEQESLVRFEVCEPSGSWTKPWTKPQAQIHAQTEPFQTTTGWHWVQLLTWPMPPRSDTNTPPPNMLVSLVSNGHTEEVVQGSGTSALGAKKNEPQPQEYKDYLRETRFLDFVSYAHAYLTIKHIWMMLIKWVRSLWLRQCLCLVLLLHS